jgi:hypothetical protein
MCPSADANAPQFAPTSPPVCPDFIGAFGCRCWASRLSRDYESEGRLFPSAAFKAAEVGKQLDAPGGECSAYSGAAINRPST